MIQVFQVQERLLLEGRNKVGASGERSLALSENCLEHVWFRGPSPLLCLFLFSTDQSPSFPLGRFFSPSPSLPLPLPLPITLASHQDSLVLSHPIDGFMKASRDTRLRTYLWARRLVSSSSGPARALQGISPSPSGSPGKQPGPEAPGRPVPQWGCGRRNPASDDQEVSDHPTPPPSQYAPAPPAQQHRYLQHPHFHQERRGGSLDINDGHCGVGMGSEMNAALMHRRHTDPVQLQVAGRVRWARALYDFEALEDDELGFRSGEVVEVLDSSNPSWWTGRLHNKLGLFPANYVAPMIR
uniref:Adapter protein GRID n=1 Tax=Canis lupus familiaris TaxID=9615 RepID=A0A8C0QKX2_CANLF